MMKTLLTLFFVIMLSLSGTATIAVASSQLPDLVPVVINVNEGLVEVRNLGNAVAKPSQVFVNCSVIHAGKSAPCAAGLKLPGYIEKWNVLSYDIPALQPGEHYRFQVFGAGALPRRPGTYGMSITVDAARHVEEISESNNATRLDMTIEKGGGVLVQYSDLLPHQVLSVGKAKGGLKLRVLMSGKLIEAAVYVTQPGRMNQLVLQTKSRHSDTYEHMKQTPFEVFLPAGRYDLYVQARVSPLQVYMQTRALPVVIKAGKRLEKTVTIPSGRLLISSSIAGENISGMTVEISGGLSYRNKLPGFDGYTIYSSLKTPIDTDVPPGEYKIKVRNPETGQVQTSTAIIKENDTLEKSLVFDKFHAGYLTFNLLVDGKKIPAKDFYKYVALTITSTSTSKKITPGSGNRLRLPSDVYDVVVHELAWGNADRHLSGIIISDDETTERSIILQQPGELQLVSRWRTSKFVDAECAVLKPILTAAVIPVYAYLYLTDTHLAPDKSDEIAKCHPDITPVVVSYTRLDRQSNYPIAPSKVYSAEYPAMKTRVAAIRLVPGLYDFSVWPLKHKELRQTLKNIRIDSDKAVLKELLFDLPD